MNYATATSGILGWVSGGSTPLNISSSFRTKYYTETCRVIPDFLPLSFSYRWIKVCTAVSRVCVLYRQRRFLTSKQTTTPHCWLGYMLSVEIRGLAPTLFSMPLPPPKKNCVQPLLCPFTCGCFQPLISCAVCATAVLWWGHIGGAGYTQDPFTAPPLFITRLRSIDKDREA